MDLRAYIRDIPDFPVPGVVFKDITPLLGCGPAFHTAIDELAARTRPYTADVVVAMESRGFLFAAPLAYKLNLGFVPVRKQGKLPAEALSVEYALEYGKAVVEIHRDAILAGQRVLIVDDVLATGGTASAAVSLIEQLGGQVAALAFIIELTFLKGRERLVNYPLVSIIQY
jgi:adenine phosphoribosyltransferase